MQDPLIILITLVVLALLHTSYAAVLIQCSSDANKCLQTPSNQTLKITCNKCISKHAFCYLGSCICHPGYDPTTHCMKKLTRLNPWQTKGCLALHTPNTFAANMSLAQIGGEFSKFGSLCPRYQKSCAYLCFSHSMYGVAAVPISLWQIAQTAEANLWRQVSNTNSSVNPNDRADEHWQSFDSLRCLPADLQLGRTIEVGAGPWTQIKAYLYVRPDLVISDLTIFEPSATRYMAEVSTCSYRNGVSLDKWNAGKHTFPVRVVSAGGEALPHTAEYDTLVSVNVLEHVQNAFEYLTRLYTALKPGGLLIFHERYYSSSHIMDGDLYHPIRIKKKVLDHFLSGFTMIYNNCTASYAGRVGEVGYYVIARKN